jgi:hypothetical protein
MSPLTPLLNQIRNAICGLCQSVRQGRNCLLKASQRRAGDAGPNLAHSGLAVGNTRIDDRGNARIDHFAGIYTCRRTAEI